MIVTTKLDANECPWPTECGIDPATLGALHRYPDPLDHQVLKTALAARADVRRARVSLGNGSDDLIFRLLHANQGAHVVVFTPGYPFHHQFAIRNHCRVTTLALDEDHQPPRSLAEDVAQLGADVAFVCYPNNPTGNCYDADLLVRAVERNAATMWVFDEAYFEFSRRSMLSLLEAGRENVVVLRTLSKAWGLAGARFGYALSSERVAQQLEATLLPYHISSLTLRTARARLAGPGPEEVVARVVQERERVARSLSTISGVSVAPSQANFLWVTCTRPGLAAHLQRTGVLVKALHPAASSVRITVGTPQENGRVVRHVEEYASGA